MTARHTQHAWQRASKARHALSLRPCAPCRSDFFDIYTAFRANAPTFKLGRGDRPPAPAPPMSVAELSQWEADFLQLLEYGTARALLAHAVLTPSRETHAQICSVVTAFRLHSMCWRDLLCVQIRHVCLLARLFADDTRAQRAADADAESRWHDQRYENESVGAARQLAFPHNQIVRFIKGPLPRHSAHERASSKQHQ